MGAGELVVPFQGASPFISPKGGPHYNLEGGISKEKGGALQGVVRQFFRYIKSGLLNGGTKIGCLQKKRGEDKIYYCAGDLGRGMKK